MTTPTESGGGRRIGRILTLMGDLLQEMGTLVEDGAAGAAAALTDAGAGAGGPALGPAADSAGLWLVVEREGERMALPWTWVSGTRLSAGGRLESLQLDDGARQTTLRIDRLLGLWTRREAESWQGQLEWLTSAASLPTEPARPAPRAGWASSSAPEGQPAVAAPFPAPDAPPGGAPFFPTPAGAPTAPAPPPGPQPEAGPPPPPAPRAESGPPRPVAFAAPPHRAPAGPGPAMEPPAAQPSTSPAPWPPGGPQVAAESPAGHGEAPEARPEVGPPAPVGGKVEAGTDRVWVVSPSALARRFLMRHLCELGVDVLEARDLDDPLLPADLKGVAALFLDESLLEDWKARPASTRSAPPLVCLTVDGTLSVPPEGTSPPGGAILPRPFERAEVERVLHWLHSLQQGSPRGGYGDDGEEDDTWLFADPFGAARAGEHSYR